jgi:hypothetical protein
MSEKTKTMSSKETAEKLYNKFYNTSFHSNSVAVRKSVTKENAIKCVDTIMEVLGFDFHPYWDSVKEAIEKL